MSKKETAHATLTLTITYDQISLPDIIEAAKEVIDGASGQGSVEGYLDIHRAARIQVEDLQ